jgi:hypothetical protein
LAGFGGLLKGGVAVMEGVFGLLAVEIDGLFADVALEDVEVVSVVELE